MSAGRDVPFKEWDITGLAPFEPGVGWFYEYPREFVLRMPSQQARDYRGEVERLRDLVRGKSGREKRLKLMELHKPLPTIIPVGFEPEWPDTPYLAIDAEERKRRLMDLLPEFLPGSIEALVADLLIAREPEEVSDRLLEKMDRGEYPIESSEHLHNWVIYFLGRHALQTRSRLDTIYQRDSVKILVDRSIGLTAFLRRTKALYQMVTGQSAGRPTKRAGRRAGNLYARNIPDLKRLGAYRLVKVFGLSVEDAIALMVERLGKKAYYTDPRNFMRAVKECEKQLGKFLQPPD